uniref:Hint domain-containing protein n=1 Tax=Yoonia sp. TaxID=2212373 RepID=UPI004047EFCA|tara:strand:+ start:16520 stop:17590 length:1071 start_codon:yes stop_codon:yes gene_type:complete
MKTGFNGTFVISWSQTSIDGQFASPVTDLSVGTAWSWTGDAARVDGPSGILPLGVSEGEANIRKRAALTVRRLLTSAQIDTRKLDAAVLQDPLFDDSFRVTDGFDVWTITLIDTGAGRKPLCMFLDEIPPQGCDLWVVDHHIKATLRRTDHTHPGGVICFTPGTMIMTPDGVRDVACLSEGDHVQTADNGSTEVLWLGQRRISGARLQAIPALTPVRLRAGALDKDVPDAGLLVSPDHRIVLRGPQARALYNCDEVLVTARDLINDHSIIRDHSLREVTYIHMMLPQHEVVFANGVATESFHPAAAELSAMDEIEEGRLYDRLPDLRGDMQNYGAYARRVLSDSEAAILQYDGKRP